MFCASVNKEEEDVFLEKHVNFECGCVKEKSNIMNLLFEENTYTIVYTGKLYNYKELREILEDNGFVIKGKSDKEIILKAYIFYGKDVCTHLNGVFSFAIWNAKKEELFLCRDKFGIKPLFFSKLNDDFVFASEIKQILNYPSFKPVVGKEEISELLGLGPCHTSGKTIFKDIEEVKPAHFLVINKENIYDEEYWCLESKVHKDDFETTCNKIKFLIKDSVERQLDDEEDVCTLLSGGLDSSVITAIASNYYKEKGKVLKTFSVDYVDNEKNFVKSDFQPNTDNYYINLMVDKFKTNHTKIVLDTPELYESLEDAMISRDGPGMADVDSSYLLFFKNVKKTNNIALSGECSDEIFGGYPWYFREDGLNSKTFPWSLAIEERKKLLNCKYKEKIDLESYIDFRYKESLSKVKCLEGDSEPTKNHRKLIYLTSNWFMSTLIDRTDRAASYCGFEARVPFCDYRIVEYLWNIPWEMKAYKGREKGLLRYCMEDLLPDEVVYRKKSPYPKTHNPNYLQMVKKGLTEIMKNKNCRLKEILDEDYIWEVINTDGKNFVRPWFGQLMTGPQFMAYLIQFEQWLNRYNVEILI